MLKYDPHERLWNGANVARWRRLHLQKLLIVLDTLLLGTEALADRVRTTGLRSVFRTTLPRDTPIFYIDIGLHREAKQLHLVSQWARGNPDFRAIGFEANPAHYAEFRATEPAVEAENLALVGPSHTSPSVRLYLDGKSGLGDSLVATEGEYIDVAAIRLSQWIAQRGIDLGSAIVFLRMNIEGAELGVIEDLTSSMLHPHIDGYFGMWNDVAKKAGPEAHHNFESLLQKFAVRSFPFNDRDHLVPLRCAFIRYRMVTAAMAAQARKFPGGQRRPPLAEAR